MAINKIPYGATAPGDLTDWEKQIAVSQANSLAFSDRLDYDFSGGTIKAGTIVRAGGLVYIADSDTAISGSTTDYVRFVASGDVLIPSFEASLSGVTYNETYSYYTDASGSTYLFDEFKAFLKGDISELKTKLSRQMRDYTKPETQTLNDGETIVIGYRDIDLIINTSVTSADIPSIPDGTFEGQKITAIVNGSGMGSVQLPGSYKVYITLNPDGYRSLKAVFEWLGGEWVASGGVTAVYSSGDWTVHRNTNSIDTLSAELSATAVDVSVSGFWLKGVTFTYPFTLSTIINNTPSCMFNDTGGADTAWATSKKQFTTYTTVGYMSAINQSNIYPTIVIEGRE